MTLDRLDTLRLRLFGRQVVSQHLLRVICHFLRRLGYLHSALQSARQMALPSPACVHLCLHYQAALGIQRGRDLESLFRREGDTALLYGDSEVVHDLLALVLMQMKVSFG